MSVLFLACDDMVAHRARSHVSRANAVRSSAKLRRVIEMKIESGHGTADNFEAGHRCCYRACGACRRIDRRLIRERIFALSDIALKNDVQSAKAYAGALPMLHRRLLITSLVDAAGV